MLGHPLLLAKGAAALAQEDGLLGVLLLGVGRHLVVAGRLRIRYGKVGTNQNADNEEMKDELVQCCGSSEIICMIRIRNY